MEAKLSAESGVIRREEVYPGCAKRIRVKKDIIIKAGTILNGAPIKTERAPGVFYDVVIGLSANTIGRFEYEASHPDVVDYFEEVEDGKA